MDVLAITCLAIIAVASVVIAWLLLGLAHEARRVRHLVEDVASRLGNPTGEATGRAIDTDARSWAPVDARPAHGTTT